MHRNLSLVEFLFERALSISPRDPFNSFFYGGTAVAHYLSGHFEEAIKWSRQTLQLRPWYLGSYRILCASLAKAGQTAEAAEVAANLRRLAPEMSINSIRKIGTLHCNDHGDVFGGPADDGVARLTSDVARDPALMSSQ